MVKKKVKTEDVGPVKPMAVWDNYTTMTFCDICVKEINAGNRPTSYFSKEGWANVEKEFNEVTTREYDIEQLRNRWDNLKVKWSFWRQLLHKDTELGWDPKKNTVCATPEWWDGKIMENKKFKPFRKEGINPDLADKLDIMFGGIVATGKYVWAPSSGMVPTNDSPKDCINLEGSGDSDEESRVSGDSQQMNLDPAYESVRPIGSNNRKKRDIEDKRDKRKAKAGKSGSDNLKILDKLTESIITMSNATSHEGPTITEAFNVLNGMEEVPRNSELRFFAGNLLSMDGKRAVFMNFPPEERLGYLKFAFDSWKNK